MGLHKCVSLKDSSIILYISNKIGLYAICLAMEAEPMLVVHGLIELVKKKDFY